MRAVSTASKGTKASKELKDVDMMRRALFHAARGVGRTTPNPMVGAVVVSPEGVVVGQGFHQRAGEAHAEVRALAEAGDRARGATLYVTLEPCCHVGRTGPCTAKILDTGIARVVAAMRDPDPRVAGRGFDELRSRGVVVEVGVLEREAARLNEAFVTVRTAARPFVILKAATSLDARVAAGPGERTPISAAASNRRTQSLRASVDAVAVGSETLLVDDPLLTVREVRRVRPLIRVIFDRRLRAPPGARVFSTLAEGPVIIVTRPDEGDDDGRRERLRAAGAHVLETAALQDGLRALLAWDVSTLLVEGGPRLQASFWQEGVVDRLHLIVAPHRLGARGIHWLDVDTVPTVSLTGIRAEPRGPDIWIEADVHRDR